MSPRPDDAIHPVAEAGFSRSAAAYERGRPGYPQDAVDWLASVLGLAPGRTALDLGAGTGKLTRLLVPTGARLVAIEPLEQMRAQLEQAVAGVEALAGTAEEIPLPDGSVDAVVAGQAFHWFDVERAAPEIHRVLRPGGLLGLVWNVRDPEDAAQQELELLLRRYRHPDLPRAYTWDGDESSWRRPLDASPLFERAGEASFPYGQATDREGLVSRIASVSFVAALDEEERASLLGEVETLAGSLPEPIELRHVTRTYAYRRVSSTPGAGHDGAESTGA